MCASNHNLVAHTHVQNAQAARQIDSFAIVPRLWPCNTTLATLVASISRHAGTSALPMLHSSDSPRQEGSAKHTADVGLLPVRRRRHQVLMDALVGGERSDPASLFGSPRSSSQSPAPERGEQ